MKLLHKAHRPRPDSPESALADLAVIAAELSVLSARVTHNIAVLTNQPQPAPPPVPVPAPPPPPPPPAPTPTPPPPPPAGGTINWPNFQGTATFVATSRDKLTNVYYDASLGTPALACAQALVAAAPGINAENDKMFGITQTTPVNVIVYALNNATDGTGGADHMACNFTNGGNIEVCVDFSNPSFCGFLYEAELSECAMNGNLCGESSGETLSRWAAIAAANNAEASQFATATQWAADGFVNWVDVTEGTDEDADSIGCGMAFLSWMMATYNIKIEQIAEEMVKLGDSGTLAQLHEALTGTTASPWATFLAACKAVPGGITTDDPFKALNGTIV